MYLPGNINGLGKKLQLLMAEFFAGNVKGDEYISTNLALRGSLNAAWRAVPHLIAHKVASINADAVKKRKRVDINVKHSQEPQSKKAFVDTGDIETNAIIDGSGIVLDSQDDWGIYTRTSRNQCYR